MPMSVCLCVCPCFRKISKCNISAISQPITMKFGTHWWRGGRGLPSLIALLYIASKVGDKFTHFNLVKVIELKSHSVKLVRIFSVATI